MYRMLVLAIWGCANASAQPVQAELDHVVIAVHNLNAAKTLYSGLGFSITPGGRIPTGTENVTVDFRTTQWRYLELITPHDRTLSGGAAMAKFLEQGEGARYAGLKVTSAEQAARDLTGAGLKVTRPTAGTIRFDADKQPPPPRWWTLGFVDDVATRPVFLIQYAPLTALAPLPSVPPHPNSATSLSALLIAVNDLDTAAAGYAGIAKAGGREILMPEFGATAKEMALGSGSIFLLKATDPAGPTARRLKTRGEGILGLRISVTDLDQARKQIGAKNVSKDPQSVLVPAENAAGVWLEFRRAQ